MNAPHLDIELFTSTVAFISAIDVMDHVCVCDIDGTTDTSRLRKPRDE